MTLKRILVFVLWMSLVTAAKPGVVKSFQRLEKNRTVFEAQVASIKGIWNFPHKTEKDIDKKLAIADPQSSQPQSPAEVVGTDGSVSDMDRHRGEFINKVLLLCLSSYEEMKVRSELKGFDYVAFALGHFPIEVPNSFMRNFDWAKKFYSKTCTARITTNSKELKELSENTNAVKVFNFLVVMQFANFKDHMKVSNCGKEFFLQKDLEDFKKIHNEILNAAQTLKPYVSNIPQKTLEDELNAFSLLLLKAFEHNLNWFCKHRSSIQFDADNMINLIKMQFADLGKILSGEEGSERIFNENEKQRIVDAMDKARQDLQIDSENVSRLLINEDGAVDSAISESGHSEFSTVSLPLSSSESPYVFYHNKSNENTFIALNMIQVNLFYLFRAWFFMHGSNSKQDAMVEKLMDLMNLLFRDLNSFLSQISNNSEDKKIGLFAKPSDHKIHESSVNSVPAIKQETVQAAFIVIERSMNRVLQIITANNNKGTWFTYIENLFSSGSTLDTPLASMWTMIAERMGSNDNLKNSDFFKAFKNFGENLHSTFELKDPKMNEFLVTETMTKLEANISELDYTNWRCNYLVHVFFYGYGGEDGLKTSKMPLHVKIFFLRNFQCMYNQHANFYQQVNNMIEIHRNENRIKEADSDNYRKRIFTRMFFLQECYDEKTMVGQCGLDRYQRFLTEFYVTAFEKQVGMESSLGLQSSIPSDPSTLPQWLSELWKLFTENKKKTSTEDRHRTIVALSDEKHQTARRILHWIFFPLLKLKITLAQPPNYLDLISSPLVEMQQYLGPKFDCISLTNLPEYTSLNLSLKDLMERSFSHFYKRFKAKLFSFVVDEQNAGQEGLKLEYVLQVLRVFKLADQISPTMTGLTDSGNPYKELSEIKFKEAAIQFSGLISLLHNREPSDYADILADGKAMMMIV